MGFDAFDELFIHLLALARCAKGAIITETSCAPRDLRRLHGGKIAPPPPVIFRQPRKGDMVCVQI